MKRIIWSWILVIALCFQLCSPMFMTEGIGVNTVFAEETESVSDINLEQTNTEAVSTMDSDFILDSEDPEQLANEDLIETEPEQPANEDLIETEPEQPANEDLIEADPEQSANEELSEADTVLPISEDLLEADLNLIDDITLDLANLAGETVSIQGSDSITIPDIDTLYEYDLLIDQTLIPRYSVTWTLIKELEGVSWSNSDNKLQVLPTTKAGEVTLQAEYGEMSATKTIQVVYPSGEKNTFTLNGDVTGLGEGAYRVVLSGSNSYSKTETYTSALTSYKFDYLPKGSYNLTFYSGTSGYNRIHYISSFNISDDTTKDISFRKVSGTIYDSDGELMKNASFSVYLSSYGTMRSNEKTDGDGRFSIIAADDSTYQYMLYIDPFYLDLKDSNPKTQWFKVNGSDLEQNFVYNKLAVLPRYTITGTVPSGHAGLIYLSGMDNNNVSQTYYAYPSASSTSYTISNVNSGTYTLVMYKTFTVAGVSSGSVYKYYQSDIKVDDNKIIDIPEFKTIEGKVDLPNGTLIGTSLFVNGSIYSSTAFETTVQDGSFELLLIDSQTYKAYYQLTGINTWYALESNPHDGSTQKTFTTAQGTPLTFKPQDSLFTIEGYVKQFENGSLVPKSDVSIQLSSVSSTATPNGEGYYKFNNIISGSKTITASENNIIKYRQSKSTSSNITWDQIEFYHLFGKLSLNKNPELNPPNATVSDIEIGIVVPGYPYIQYSKITTDAEGNFTLNLAKGINKIYYRTSSSGAWLGERTVNIVNNDITGFNFVYGEDYVGEINGTVTSGLNQGDTIYLYAENSVTETAATVIGTGGKFEFKNLPYGTYKIATKKMNPLRGYSVTLSSVSKTATPSFAIGKTVVTLTDMSEKTIPYKPIYLQDEKGITYDEQISTNENGQVTVTGIGGVNLKIKIKLNGISYLDTSCSINCDTDLYTAKVHTIQGTVTLNSEPMALARVDVSWDNLAQTIYTDANGYYVAIISDSGEYKVVALLDDMAGVKDNIAANISPNEITDIKMTKEAVSESISLKITVKNTKGVPITDAIVTAYKGDATIESIAQNDNGVYTMSNVFTEGTYKLNVNAPNYSEDEKNVTILDYEVASGQPKELISVLPLILSGDAFKDTDRNRLESVPDYLLLGQSDDLQLIFKNGTGTKLTDVVVTIQFPKGTTLDLTRAKQDLEPYYKGSVSIKDMYSIDTDTNTITIKLPFINNNNADVKINLNLYIHEDYAEDFVDLHYYIHYNGIEEPIGTGSTEIPIYPEPITISAPEQVQKGVGFEVSGKNYTSGSVTLIEGENSKLATDLTSVGGEWKTTVTFNEAGVYNLTAKSGDLKSKVISVIVSESDNFLRIEDVQCITHSNQVIKMDTQSNIVKFTEWVNNYLFGMPFDVKVKLANVDNTKPVKFTFLGKDYNATLRGGYYTSKIAGWNGSGVGELIIHANDKKITVAEVLILIDPSGYVYDYYSGDRIQNAIVTCERLEGNEYVFWNAQDYGQVNPQITDALGLYGWMVPAGTYRVKVQKEGYEEYVTDIDEMYSAGGASTIVIPPPRDDINIGLYDTKELYVTRFDPNIGYNESLKVEFSKPIDTSTVTEYSFYVLDEDDKKVSGEFSYDEKNLKIIFTPDGSWITGVNYKLYLTNDIQSKPDRKNQKKTLADWNDTFRIDIEIKALDPLVIGFKNNSNQMNVRIDDQILLTFPEKISSINPSDIEVYRLDQSDLSMEIEKVAGSLSIKDDDKVVFAPHVGFLLNSAYKLKLKQGIKAESGNYLDKDITFNFYTNGEVPNNFYFEQIGTDTEEITVQQPSVPKEIFLTGITLSNGLVIPSFSKDKLNYTVNTPNDIERVTVTPIASDNSAEISINGDLVTSKEIDLTVGSNRVEINVASKTYILTIVRAQVEAEPEEPTEPEGPTEPEEPTEPELEVSPYLSSIDLSGGFVLSNFKKDLYYYSLNVGNGVSKITVAPKAENTLATIEINGEKISSKDISLKVGSNKVTIAITHGNEKRTYTINIKRANTQQDKGDNSGSAPQGESAEPKNELQNQIEDITPKDEEKEETQEESSKISSNDNIYTIGTPLKAETENAQKLLIASNVKMVGKPMSILLKLNGERFTLVEIELDNNTEITTFVQVINNKLIPVPTSFADGLSGKVAKLLINEEGIYVAINAERQFEDIKGHWAEAYIKNLASKLIVNGNGSSVNSYEPNRFIKRAEIATLLLNVIGIYPRETETATFNDVSNTAWYASIAKTAYKFGIMSGSEGNFRPESNMTREEFAVAIINLLSLVDKNIATTVSTNTFIDSGDVSGWAQSAMTKCIGLNLFVGYEDGTLRPKQQLTRAEIAVLIEKLLQIINQ